MDILDANHRDCGRHFRVLFLQEQIPIGPRYHSRGVEASGQSPFLPLSTFDHHHADVGGALSGRPSCSAGTVGPNRHLSDRHCPWNIRALDVRSQVRSELR